MNCLDIAKNCEVETSQKITARADVVNQMHLAAVEQNDGLQVQMNVYEQPDSLKERHGLLDKVKQLAQRHLLELKVPIKDAIQSHEEVQVRLVIEDTSGMSNVVYIVSAVLENESSIVSVLEKKIIMRFFESQCANFDLENKVLVVASEHGLAPAMISTDWKTYRVEHFYEGSPLTFDELVKPDVYQHVMSIVGQFNYNKELFGLLASKDDSVEQLVLKTKAMRMVADREDGWYWKAKKLSDMLDLVQTRFETSPPEDELALKCLADLKLIKEHCFDNTKKFVEEYTSLLPKVDSSNVDKLIVFSHNDIQENNLLSKKGPDGKITEAKVIDFEYAEINYRGMDLALYFVECSINYKTALECGFEYYEHLFPKMNESISVIDEKEESSGSSDAPKSFVSRVLYEYLVSAKKTMHHNQTGGIRLDDKEDSTDDSQSFEVTEQEVRELNQQVNRLMLSLDLYWITWSIVMATPMIQTAFKNETELVDDDKLIVQMLKDIGVFNVSYAALRLNMYQTHHDELLKFA